MDEPEKTSGSDSGGNVGSPRTPAEKARPWTQEEMEAAEPYPMPEVPDDEAGTSEVATPRISDVRVSQDQIVVDHHLFPNAPSRRREAQVRRRAAGVVCHAWLTSGIGHHAAR